jgi:hypothetical protein
MAKNIVPGIETIALDQLSFEMKPGPSTPGNKIEYTLTLMHNGTALHAVQIGRLSPLKDRTDPVTIWQGAQYYVKVDNRFKRVNNKKDVEWTKSLQFTPGKKKTSKLMVTVSLNRATEQSQKTLAFFKHIEEMIITAITKGVPSSDGKTRVYPCPDHRDAPESIVRGLFSALARDPDETQVSQTGTRYNPDIKLRMRVFVQEDAAKNPTVLSTPARAKNWGPNPAYSPDDPASREFIDTDVDDVFEYLTQPAEGALILSVGDISIEKKTHKIFTDINVDMMRLRRPERSNDVQLNE